ncbi:MAG: RNA methyltransferase [Petrimonas sp.]|nr:RNA methyltransferase [Petrimonas sp.]
MLSKNKIKYIQSLKDKKHRLEHGTFVAEGKKIVSDLMESCKCQFVAGLPEILEEIEPITAEEIIAATTDELKKASFLKTAPSVIGVFYQPENTFSEKQLKDDLHLVLDGIQDPGNLGTIVRLADWFGIEHIFCSPDTADIYNPKTVQATMGAIARVKVHYTDLTDFLKKNTGVPVYGTFLEGENIYTAELPANGFIVMGNEGNGIRAEISELVTRKLFIPNYPAGKTTSESLNVSVATAVICSEFRRRI